MFFKNGIFEMNNDQVMRQAPAVFAKAPHSNTSDRYLFVDTNQMLQGMKQEGWSCVSAVQTMNKSSGAEKVATNKHALFFSRTEMLGDHAAFREAGATIPLIKVENSHNGLSSFCLSTGFFRKACSNGLTVPETIYAAPKVRHTKSMYQDVIDATYKVLNDFPMLMNMQAQLRDIKLTNEEKMLLSDTAAEIFFSREERIALNKRAKQWGNDRYLLESQLVAARRSEDRVSDLWTVTNIIQENIIRGHVQTVADNGRLHYKRKVTSIDRDNDIHDKLFTLTQKFAELKGVRIGKAA